MPSEYAAKLTEPSTDYRAAAISGADRTCDLQAVSYGGNGGALPVRKSARRVALLSRLTQ